LPLDATWSGRIPPLPIAACMHAMIRNSSACPWRQDKGESDKGGNASTVRDHAAAEPEAYAKDTVILRLHLRVGCCRFLHGHLTKVSANVVLGVLLLGILENSLRILEFDKITRSPSLGRVHIEKARLIRNALGLLEVMGDDGNGVLV